MVQTFVLLASPRTFHLPIGFTKIEMIFSNVLLQFNQLSKTIPRRNETKQLMKVFNLFVGLPCSLVMSVNLHVFGSGELFLGFISLPNGGCLCLCLSVCLSLCLPLSLSLFLQLTPSLSPTHPHIPPQTCTL